MTNACILQWIDSVLAKGETIEFFHDEYRCPVYVKDLVSIIQALIARWISGLRSFIYMSCPTFSLLVQL